MKLAQNFEIKIATYSSSTEMQIRWYMSLFIKKIIYNSENKTKSASCSLYVCTFPQMIGATYCYGMSVVMNMVVYLLSYRLVHQGIVGFLISLPSHWAKNYLHFFCSENNYN